MAIETDKPVKPMQRTPQPNPADQPKKEGLGGRIRNTFEDIRSEIAKVTWPTREETRNLTIVVIGISAFIGILLGAVDAIATAAYGLLPK